MGCGKTTIGKLISKKIGLNFIDTDLYIESKMNMSINEIFGRLGEPYFRILEDDVAKNLLNFIPSVVSIGGGMLENHNNISILKNTGKLIFLNASISNIKERLKYDSSRPLIKDKKKLEYLYNSRLETYKNAADITVCADDSPYNICTNILNLINNI